MSKNIPPSKQPESANQSQHRSDTKSCISNDGLDSETDSILRRSTPSSSADELPFDRLEHYEIVGRIGTGGMGDVYQGYEKDLDRTVAIKVLPAEFARNDELVKRFYAEATAVAKLSHPNVIKIYYIGKDHGRHFFAMQYVEGESLTDLLRRRKSLEVQETVAIVSQALLGLDAAHQRGLVHRDIKPGNLLIDQNNNRVLLADFGLVKSINSGAQMTATGMIMGTVDYISPEQGRGQEVDGRSDLYAIGVLMYQMLSGRLPFKAETATDIIFKHVYEAPDHLDQIVPDIPRPLAIIVDKLMAKSPDDRYQKASDVLTELRKSVAGVPLPQDDEVISPAVESDSIHAPLDFSDVTMASPELTSPTAGWIARTRQRLLNLFRTHAPEFIQQLQNTQHQVDGAVAEYERRCSRIQQLANEAEEVLALFQAQARNYQQLVTDAQARIDSAERPDDTKQFIYEKIQHERMAGEIEAQIKDQLQQVEEIHTRLSKAQATLVKLQTQRDVLSARLKAAQSTSQLAGDGQNGNPRKRAWIYSALGAAIGCLLLGAVVMVVNWNKSNKHAKVEDAKVEQPNVEQPKVEPAVIEPSLEKKEDRIEIISAKFGTGRKWVDVKKQIETILNSESTRFLNSARGLKAKDPLPGYIKKTVIQYRINGVRKTISLRAGPSRRYNLRDHLK